MGKIYRDGKTITPAPGPIVDIDDTLGATIVNYPFDIEDNTVVYTFASSSGDVYVSASGGKGLYKFNVLTKLFELQVANWTCRAYFEDSRGNIFFSGTKDGSSPGSGEGSAYWKKINTVELEKLNTGYLHNFIETENHLYTQYSGFVNDGIVYAIVYATNEVIQVRGVPTHGKLLYVDREQRVYHDADSFEKDSLNVIEGLSFYKIPLANENYSSSNDNVFQNSAGQIIFKQSTYGGGSRIYLIDLINKASIYIGYVGHYKVTFDEYAGKTFLFSWTGGNTSASGQIYQIDFENNKLIYPYTSLSNNAIIQTFITPTNEYFAVGNSGSKIILKYDTETEKFIKVSSAGGPITPIFFDNGDFVFNSYGSGGIRKYVKESNSTVYIDSIHLSNGECTVYKSNNYMAFCNKDIHNSITMTDPSFGIFVMLVTAASFQDVSIFSTSGGYFVSNEDENYIYFNNSHLAKQVRFNKADKTFTELDIKVINPMRNYNLSVPFFNSEPSVLFNEDNKSLVLDNNYAVVVNKKSLGIAVSNKKLIMV